MNHRTEFVTPQGVHTQRIEAFWSRMKNFLRAKGRNIPTILPARLDEFIWRQRLHEQQIENVFLSIMKTIGQAGYNVEIA